MSEPEIEALMAGQEDENGSVHYEGTSSCAFCSVHVSIQAV